MKSLAAGVAAFLPPNCDKSTSIKSLEAGAAAFLPPKRD
jgi:hypothetical protein